MIDLETLAKARAESGQCALVEGEFPCWQQMNAFDLVDRALGLRVEGAQRFDFLIEQVDAVGQAAAHREQVQQGAAHGVVAMFINRIDTAVAGGIQVLAHAVDVQPLADLQHQYRAAKEGAGRNAVQQGDHRHDEDAMTYLGQAIQGLQALGDDVLVRREAVVGQGFPIGEGGHRQVRGEEPQFLFQAVRHGGIPGDDQAQAGVFGRGLGNGQGPRRRWQVAPGGLVAKLIGQRSGVQK